MKTALITGGTGFLGSALTRYFLSKGWTAIACGRSEAAVPRGAEFRRYDLRWTDIPEGFFDGVDAVIHAAVCKTGSSSMRFTTNVDASAVLFEETRKRGIFGIFVSSLAAHEQAASSYGRHKYQLERLLEPMGVTVVRPGLILGHGGLFAKMLNHARRGGIVPLVGNGMQALQTVHIDDVSLAIYNAAATAAHGRFTVAEETPVPYKSFFEALYALLERTPRFIRTPYALTRTALRAAAALRIPMPIDEDNYLGLAHMKFQEPYFKGILPGAPRAYSDSLQNLFRPSDYASNRST